MRELLIVMRREFRERVRSRSFILSTLLTPVFVLGVFLVPMLADNFSDDDQRAFALIDASPTQAGPAVVAALEAAGGVGQIQLFTAPGGVGMLEDSLARAVLDESLHGVIILPSDVTEGGSVRYRARSVTDQGLQRRISSAVTTVVQEHRLATAGIDPALLSSVMAPVPMDAARLTGDGDAGQSSESGMMFSFLVGFALYMLILLYGVQVLGSVQEEKTNRISEILVSSMQASHLMIGKVLGVGLAALLQIVIWIVVAIVLAGPVIGMMGGGGEELAGLFGPVEPSLLIVLLAYLLLGFFLYASLFAAAGAAASSTEDAQRFTFPLIMPLVIPMMFMTPIISAPQGTIAVILGWFPLTMPLAMPMRIGAGGPGSLEIATTLAVLVLSVALLGILAGKIYRIGILSTGKRPTMGEIMKWIRMA